MKPLIGISCNTICLEGRERFILSSSYVKCIEKAGGIPLILPFLKEDVEKQMELVDGLLLSGGQDVDPAHFDEKPAEGLGAVSKERDAHELELVRAAQKQNKPILGICRGAQVLNVAFGGSLYQHIGDGHREGVHKVVMCNELFGKKEISVNSFHHQAVKKLAPDFEVAALSDDGIIEAIVKKGSNWVVGVQWHPEQMECSEMDRLFATFIQVALSLKTTL